MTLSPADGERSSLRGYRWQYDQLAMRVYDALRAGGFQGLILTDPDAGRVDDLVLLRDTVVDAYQFKSSESRGYLTFRQLLQKTKLQGGGVGPSLFRSLADGWKRLGENHENVRVHLVAEQIASVHDHLGNGGSRPSPDHFSAFVKRVLRPLSAGRSRLDEVEATWQPALEKLQDESGLSRDDFRAFLKSFVLELGAPRLLDASSIRGRDIRALSDRLYREVSESANAVQMNRKGVLELMNWTGRVALQSRHDFPVDLDTYEPLSGAVKLLEVALEQHDSGYVAVLGPPGSGKSTLLTQALTGIAARVVRYYAYVPGSIERRTRLSGRGFLHDLVVMLRVGAPEPGDHELASENIGDLRRQLAECLDTAHAKFAQDGTRTIVVVDGLDHVERDYQGAEGLLDELPLPDALPDGVVFLVGSRTVSPLHARVREHVDRRNAVVDLQHHRLSPDSVRKICQRNSITADYGGDVHTKIAEISDGHPLALTYLLNRLRDADGEEPLAVLAQAPPYAGDVAEEYSVVWEDVKQDVEMMEILAVASRLRVATTMEWLGTWANDHAVGRFSDRFLYLFRRERKRLRFFHDSFRQFVVERTSLDHGGELDPKRDAEWHRRTAIVCGASNDVRFKDEELHHLYCAGARDEALALCKQATFREQYIRLREPQLILTDIGLGLAVAADHGDVGKVVRLVLAIAEIEGRNHTLQAVDMPELLYDCGLVDEAVSFCGNSRRHSSAAQACRLAERLGHDGNVEGRVLFDLVEQDGLDIDQRLGFERPNEAATAWAKAATEFRPVEKVLDAVTHALGVAEQAERPDAGRRFQATMDGLIEALVGRSDARGLQLVDASLDRRIRDLQEGPEERNFGDSRNGEVAGLVDLQFRARMGMLDAADGTTADPRHLQAARNALRGVPLLRSTVLDAAEAFLRVGDLQTARGLIAGISYGPLRVDDLWVSLHGAELDASYRYWRLACLVGMQEMAEPEQGPQIADAGRRASSPPDAAAEALVKQIERALRELARIDATTFKGNPVLERNLLDVLSRLLRLFPEVGKASGPAHRGVAEHRDKVMKIATGVAIARGGNAPQWLSDELGRCFTNRPRAWPLKLRLDLGDALRSSGANVEWYLRALEEYEATASQDDLDGRLTTKAEAARRWLSINKPERACDRALELLRLSHGVGYRKDYQLEQWTNWLGQALAGSEGELYVDDATWLARMATAINPMTDGAPGESAAKLPAMVATVAPMASVRMFEYLVGHGQVNHLDALAELTRALACLCGEDGDWDAVELASDFVAEVMAPAAHCCYPALAEALVSAARSCRGSVRARDLANSVARRTDFLALSSTRASWRQSLAVEDSSTEKSPHYDRWPDEAKPLKLADGSAMEARSVWDAVGGVDDIIELHSREAGNSDFRWDQLISRHTFRVADIQKLGISFGGSERDSRVLLVLALAAEHGGRKDMAFSLAKRSMAAARPWSWSRSWGGTRLDAAALACRTGGSAGVVAACRDLSREALDDPTLARFLTSGLDDIVRALEPSHDWATTWGEVRGFLEGMEHGLAMPDKLVLGDAGAHWWLAGACPSKAPSTKATAHAAVAELVVRHMSHPTWVVGDNAVGVVTRALGRGNKDVMAALGRLGDIATTDDVLESAGRALEGARHRYGFTAPPALAPLEKKLADQQSEVLRDLAGGRTTRRYRPLSPLYRLTMPWGRPAFPDDKVLLEQYNLLAEHLGLDVDALLSVAETYARAALDNLPSTAEAGDSLASVGVRHVYRRAEAFASRSALGRVLAELADARELDRMGPLRAALHTLDKGLLGELPGPRPPLLPEAPVDSHDSRGKSEWFEGLENRIEEYLAACHQDGRTLLGCDAQQTVFEGDTFRESFGCGAIVGNSHGGGRLFSHFRLPLLREQLAGRWRPEQPALGQPLVVENRAMEFQQLQSLWLAFDPEVAAFLGWVADSERPGRWVNADGATLVETLWWVDGWWGRGERLLRDSEATGHCVVATDAAVEAMENAVGPVTLDFELDRAAGENSKAEHVSASRSVPLASI